MAGYGVTVAGYAEWRAAVLERYGWGCACASGCDGPVAAHHMVYGSARPRWDVENGLPLCRLHHDQVHARELLISRRWLHPEQVAWLAAGGYAVWDDTGQVSGSRWRSFAGG